jgi:hypothetical protein
VRTCQYCENPATIHATELRDGAARELHLCREHAAEQLGKDLEHIFPPLPLVPEKPATWERLVGAFRQAASTENGDASWWVERAVPVLTRWLKADDRRLRYFAVHWLGWLGRDAAAAIPNLQAALYDDGRFRRTARGALSKIEKSS